MKKSRSRTQLLSACIIAGGALTLVACGGQMAFQGSIPLTVMGTPPAPPPPPPEPEPAPRVEVRDNKIQINEKIQFEHAKANIMEASHSLLNEVVSVIKANPHIKKIAIEGHASSEGNPDFNRTLSDNRAKAVRAYLVSQGISEEMLTAKGFGSDNPIASNDTEEGREKNRRVEFNIVEQDVTQKKVEIDPKTGEERVIEKPVVGRSRD
ncbi:MAG: OmpA family protein [Myxococcales bacterium]|nr:OmpA family protein [Myxococcales bacterium]